MSQVTPDLSGLMRDADTRTMVHEISVSVTTMQETVRQIDARLDRDSRRLDDLARDNREILDKLNAMGPKVDDVLAFQKHGVPSLATKADLGDLKTEISHRPTRRQSITDLLAFGGLVGVILGLLNYFSRAH